MLSHTSELKLWFKMVTIATPSKDHSPGSQFPHVWKNLLDALLVLNSNNPPESLGEN